MKTLINKTDRVCTFCRKKFPLNKDNFYLVKSYGMQGFCYRCRECERERDKKRYNRSEKRRQYISEYHKKYNNENPEKIKAIYLVGQAIKNEKMKRQPCIKCGNKKSQGHHPDYSKPLEVIWLCALHHQLHHEELKIKVRKQGQTSLLAPSAKM